MGQDENLTATVREIYNEMALPLKFLGEEGFKYAHIKDKANRLQITNLVKSMLANVERSPEQAVVRYPATWVQHLRASLPVWLRFGAVRYVEVAHYEIWRMCPHWDIAKDDSLHVSFVALGDATDVETPSPRDEV